MAKDGRAHRESSKYILCTKIRVLKWLAKSPDLNITENYGASLARAIHQSGRQLAEYSQILMNLKNIWWREVRRTDCKAKNH